MEFRGSACAAVVLQMFLDFRAVNVYAVGFQHSSSKYLTYPDELKAWNLASVPEQYPARPEASWWGLGLRV